MPKPGDCHSSGISLGDVLRLPKRHPAWRRREAHSGIVRNVRAWPAMPREKAQAASTARPKVLMRRRGADCETAPNIDPTETKSINRLRGRSAPGPHADSH